MPYITLERITPEVYEALHAVSAGFVEEHVKAKRRSKVVFDDSEYERNMTYSCFLWKVAHIFSESPPKITFI